MEVIFYRPMAPLNVLYFHSICVLKLLTPNALSAILCRFMNNYTHLLMGSQLLISYYLYMYGLSKGLHATQDFPSPFVGERRNGAPSANQVLYIAKPRSSHVI